MTEQEWLTSTDPQAMLYWMLPEPAEGPEYGWHTSGVRWRISYRQCRMFAIACCLADGLTLEYADRNEAAGCLAETVPTVIPDYRDTEWALRWAHPSVAHAPRAVRAALLREIVGNPFRRPQLRRVTQTPEGHIVDWVEPPLTRWLAWRDGTVPALAKAIYDNRDWEQLPILADALEEAGCDRVDILTHLREPPWCPACHEGHLLGFPGKARVTRQRPKVVQDRKRSNIQRGYGVDVVQDWIDCANCGGTGFLLLSPAHYRGCWVLDLLLGKP